jgi:hypothetical protein
MAKREMPPRSWKLDDLHDLGEKEGVVYLKAVPVLILEKWIKEGREVGVANYVWTKELARRLVSDGLSPAFKPKGTSNILGAIGAIQRDRNLTRPPLTEYKRPGMIWVNMPHYEPLLQEYRQEYAERHPDQYKRLFASGEPLWGPLNTPESQTGSQAPRKGTKADGEIESLLAPLKQTLRHWQQEVISLREENRGLLTELAALRNARQAVHASPLRPIVDDELREDCANLLKSKDTFIDAIRRAGVVLEERLRMTIGTSGPEKYKEGVDLADYAFMPKTGRLSLSEHPAEQEGVRMLFRGAIQFVRNPPAHKKVQYTELEAWQTVSLIDYLLLLLRQAKLRVS